MGGLEGLWVPEALKKAHRVALCAFASFRSLLARVVKRRWQLRLRMLAPSFPAGLFVGAYAGAASVHDPGFPRGDPPYRGVLEHHSLNYHHSRIYTARPCHFPVRLAIHFLTRTVKEARAVLLPNQTDDAKTANQTLV